jgi:gamma-glutamyl:cysteine ligase YbdK (ATP-grasp superfamily)
VLQPRLVTDPNGNRTEAAFDTLGMVVGTAVMGKPLPATTEGDTLDGFDPDLPDDIARAARWRAARYGLDECLYHPIARRLRPAAEVVHALLDTVADDLRAHGDWHEITGLLAAALARGSSAGRQRALAHARGDLIELTRALVGETNEHIEPPGLIAAA